jgi:acyl-CoA thioesterase I
MINPSIKEDTAMKIGKPAKIKPLITILLITAISITAHAQNNNTNNGNTIVCLGDSLTAGGNANSDGKDDKSKSWPAFLQNKVNIPVINAGVSGNTTAQGLARVKKDVLSKNPRIVIIMLGANDAGQKVPLATTQKNLQKIIDMVNDGKRKIYLTRLYPGPDWNEKVENMFNTLASSNNIELIDAPWDDVWKNVSADGLHPNAKGYELMAEYIFITLKPYLEENNLLK